MFKTKEDVTLQKTKISLSCQVSGPQQSIDDGLYIKALQVAVSLPSAHEHTRLASGVRHGDSSTNLTKVIKVAMVKHQRRRETSSELLKAAFSRLKGLTSGKLPWVFMDQISIDQRKTKVTEKLKGKSEQKKISQVV